MKDKMWKKIEKLLKKEYSFYNKLNNEEQDDFWRDLDNRSRNIILKKTVKKHGFGKNKFYFMEYNQSLLDLNKYPTLYDVDKHEWKFQEKYRKEDKNYIPEKYEVSLAPWYKCFWNNKFTEGELIGTHFYIYEEVTRLIEDFIDNLFPLKPLKNRKIEDIFNREDKYLPIYGNKELHEKFKDWNLKYNFELFNKYKKIYTKKFKGKTFYTYKKDFEGDDNLHILFSDKSVLKKIKFKTFQKDIIDNLSEFNLIEIEIEKQFKKEKKVILKWLEENR